MLKLEKVSKYYHNNGISSLGLSDINLTLNKGEIIAVTGESGSGKTTLLNVISKLDSFDDGEIYYNDEPTSYFEIDDLDNFRKNKVGFIFQNYQILDSYSVLDNVMLPLLLKGINKKEAYKESLELIKKVGLENRIHSKGSKLSGGEKQRCVIARALSSDCEILACDEPTGNLDSKTSKEIIELIVSLSKDKLVLFVTHNLEEVLPYVTRIIKMQDGKIIEDIYNQALNNQITYNTDNNINNNININNKTKQLNNKKNKYIKPLFNISLKNVFYTPFKSLFLLIVFMVISLSYLLLAQLIDSSFNDYDSYSSYCNNFDNYIFVYNDHLKELSNTTINELNKYDCLYNNFSLETSKTIVIDNKYLNVVFEKNVPSYELVLGRLPENENECIICVNKNDYFDYQYYNDCLEKPLTIPNNLYYNLSLDLKKEESLQAGYIISDYKLVGICSYESMKEDHIFLLGSNKLFNFFTNLIMNISIEVPGYTYSMYDVEYIFVEESNDINITLPAFFKDYSSYNVKLFETYITNDYKLTYSDEITLPKVEIGLNHELKEKFIAEAYFDNNIELNKNKLEKKCYEDTFIIPSKIENLESIDTIIDKIVGIVITILLSSFLIVIFIITYFILSKVYQSKNNDYQILRTLGIAKKQMAKIINFEVFIIGNLAVIISFIIDLILINNVYEFHYLTNASFFIYLLYFILMEVFIAEISLRFNQRLFKFTVIKSKEGDLND